VVCCLYSLNPIVTIDYNCCRGNLSCL